KLFALSEAGTTILVSTHYMDEAERCHRLAILDRGVKVADGPPSELQQETGMTVIEVLAGSPAEAQAALAKLQEVRSVTQLGTRPRVLVPASLDAPLARLQEVLRESSVEADARIVSASLEDVFVAVTGSRTEERAA